MPKKSNDKIVSSFRDEFNKIIELEIGSIKSSISLHRYMQTTISTVSDRLWNALNFSSDIDLMHCTSKDLYDISNFSFQLQNNINCLEKLETKLETLKLATNFISSDDDILEKFNQCHDETLKLIEQSETFNSSFDEFITKFPIFNYISSNNDCIRQDSKNNKKEKVVKSRKRRSKKALTIPDGLKENTLLISDIEIILPFTTEDLDDKLNEYNLSSYSEVIDTFYRKSSKSFEPSVISRFKEAYSLITNKEHGSKFQALSLALELSTNYNLHPAIIAACKNLTQLDVYLSCLEYNELADFHFFDIVYNIPPTTKKHLFKKVIENI